MNLASAEAFFCGYWAQYIFSPQFYLCVGRGGAVSLGGVGPEPDKIPNQIASSTTNETTDVKYPKLNSLVRRQERDRRLKFEALRRAVRQL